jgi:hypothetical protein
MLTVAVLTTSAEPCTVTWKVIVTSGPWMPVPPSVPDQLTVFEPASYVAPAPVREPGTYEAPAGIGLASVAA